MLLSKLGNLLLLFMLTKSRGPSLRDWHLRAMPLISTAPKNDSVFMIGSLYSDSDSDLAQVPDNSPHWMFCSCAVCHCGQKQSVGGG